MKSPAVVLLSSILLLCLTGSALHAQKDGPDDDARGPIIPDGPSSEEFFGRSGLLLEAGYTNFRPWKFNAAFLNHQGFDHLIAVGFASNQAEETSTEGNDSFIGTDFTYSMHWFLPQEKSGIAADGDQIRYRIKGWELMTSTYAVNMIKNENVDFIVGLGMYWGNLKLTAQNETEASGKMLYKNPFVAPMFRSELRFNISFFSLGARFSYRHDITRSNWKRKDDNIAPLPGYLFREMQYLVYIGFRFSE